MSRGYLVDLAWIHDQGFGDFARSSAPGILSILRAARIRKGLARGDGNTRAAESSIAAGQPNLGAGAYSPRPLARSRGLVVDLGCGSGIWAERLLDTGYEVLGVDQSREMLDLAKARAPGARFVRSSIYDAEIPRCAAVTSLGECLGYLFDGGTVLERLPALFAKIHSSLEPGGVLIFDVLEPGPHEGPFFREGDGWAVGGVRTVDKTGRILMREITSFRKLGRGYRRSHEVHSVELLERSDVLASLRQAGFEARAIDRYGRHRFRTGLVGYVAVKQA